MFFERRVANIPNEIALFRRKRKFSLEIHTVRPKGVKSKHMNVTLTNIQKKQSQKGCLRKTACIASLN